MSASTTGASVAKLTIPRTPVQSTSNAMSNGVAGNSWHGLTPSSAIAGGSIQAADFGEGFEMKAWINAQLVAREKMASSADSPAASASSASPRTFGSSSSELSSTTTFLSSLLMKLQLLSSDLNTSMEHSGAELVSAMPKATREIAFIARESQQLRSHLTNILKDMASMSDQGNKSAVGNAQSTGSNASLAPTTTPTSSVPSESAASATDTIEFLQSIDAVRARVLRCAHTLEEVDQWKKREALVERMFENIQQQQAIPTTDAAASPSASAAAVVPSSAYIDLARIHRELSSMQRIVERFRETLGASSSATLSIASASASSEHESRVQALRAYQAKLAHMTELCLDDTLETLALSASSGDASGTALLLAASSSPSDASVAAGTDSSETSSAASLIAALQTLHTLYCSGSLASSASLVPVASASSPDASGSGSSSLTRVTFEAKYKAHKIHRTWGRLVSNRAADVSLPGAKNPGTRPVAELPRWMPTFFEDVVAFVRAEVAFAQRVFEEGTVAAPTSSGGQQPVERSRFGSMAGDEAMAGKTAARANDSATTAGSGASSTAAGDEQHAASIPSYAFVHRAVLECLHDELAPLLSTWFAGFLSSKHQQPKKQQDPSQVDALVALWEMTVSQLGCPLAGVLFASPQNASLSPKFGAAVAPAAAVPGTTSPSLLLPSTRSPTTATDKSSAGGDPEKSRTHHAQAQLLVSLLLAPLSRWLEEYSSLERWEMQDALKVTDMDLTRTTTALQLSSTSASSTFDASVARLSEAHKSLLSVSAAARVRCIRLSSGMLSEALLDTIDQHLYADFLSRQAQDMVKRLRVAAGLEETPGVVSTPKTTATSDSSASSDALSDLLPDSGASAAQSTSAAASAAAALALSSADTDWAHLGGGFALLRQTRTLQWDLFGPHVEQAVLQELLRDTDVLGLLRAVEEERERSDQAARDETMAFPAKGALLQQPQTKTVTAAATAGVRRSSFSSSTSPIIPNTPTSSSAAIAVSANASFSSSLSESSLARSMLVAFLLRHPPLQASLTAFVHRHLQLQQHPALMAQLLTASQARAHETASANATTGLVSHPATPAGVSAASAGVGASIDGAGTKYGFPSSSLTSPTSAGSNAAMAADAAGLGSSPSHLFPRAAAAMDALVGSCHALLFDLMFKSVARLLAGFASWNHLWHAGATGAGEKALSALALPSFSMQPSDYIIQIGEHLLTLVQQLEPYVKAEEEDEAESGLEVGRSGTTSSLVSELSPSFTAAVPTTSSALSPPDYVESDALYWLSLLSRSTFRSLVSGVLSLRALSTRGARQLGTDVEYLINVLSALGLPMPPLVLKLAAWLALTEAQLAEALAQGGSKTNALPVDSPTSTNAASVTAVEWRVDALTTEEKQMLRHLIRVRRFKTIEPQALTQLNP